MREVMRLRVEDLGMEVLGALEDGLSAVRMVVELAPDLVIDLNMKGIDGLEVIRRLVEMKTTTRTLLYTADPRAQVVDLAMQAGADGCLHKGVGHEVLEQSINTILGGGTFASHDGLVALPMPLRLEIKPVDLARSAHLVERL